MVNILTKCVSEHGSSYITNDGPMWLKHILVSISQYSSQVQQNRFLSKVEELKFEVKFPFFCGSGWRAALCGIVPVIFLVILVVLIVSQLSFASLFSYNL
jgi:hypothetical protein